MKLKKGDKILCRRTHYEGKHLIWQIGVKYEITHVSNWLHDYNVSNETPRKGLNRRDTLMWHKDLKTYFLIDEKLRKYKLRLLNKIQ